MKVLIVEDEQHIADGLKYNLEAEGYEADVAATGEEGVVAAERGGLDAVVLDVMLPGIDGFEVAKRLRARRDFTPILMLTALGRPADVIKGFEAGADDYIPKPFDLDVFLVRLHGLIRRASWPSAGSTKDNGPDRLMINGRTINFDTLELTFGDETVQLTLMEMKFLKYLIKSAGRAVSRKQILEDVWDLQEDTDTRAIDNFIVRLRKYLEDEPNRPKILVTVRGVGYRFVGQAHSE